MWTEILFYLNQLIFAVAHSHFDCVFQAAFPVGVWMRVSEMVVVAVFLFGEDAAADHRLTVDCICAGLIQSDRVKGSEHADVGDNRDIVFRVAVAIRGDVDHQTDVEIGTSVNDCVGVLGDFVVEDGVGLVLTSFHCILRAGADAASAADALVVVDDGTLLGVFALSAAAGFVFTIVIDKADCIVRAVLAAFSAGDAEHLVDDWLTAAVHFHLAGAGAAAHAQVFEGAAESG